MIAALSAAGLLLALYHRALQLRFSPGTICGNVDCAKRYVFELGYMTMPLMSATALFLNLIFAIAAIKRENDGAS